MKTFLSGCLLLALTLAAAAAESSGPAAQTAIRALLTDFLTHNSDPARHAAFWADDLVYTSAMGVVRDKATIMESVRAATKPAPATSAPAAAPGRGAPTYTAEDVTIRPYDGFAALTFRLVARYPDGTADTYRNSGTLVYRDNLWQVITWQATKIAPPDKP